MVLGLWRSASITCTTLNNANSITGQKEIVHLFTDERLLLPTTRSADVIGFPPQLES